MRPGPIFDRHAVLSRVGLILAAAAVGALSAYWVHHGCLNAPANLGGAEAGTPRARLCEQAHASDPWLLFVALPTAIVATVSASLPWRALLAVAVLMAVVMLVVSVLSNTLAYSTPGV